MPEVICCTPRRLPGRLREVAARTALLLNPVNGRRVRRLRAAGVPVGPEHIAVLADKYWPAHGVELTVGFLERTQAALADRVIAHMNAWAARCNVRFTLERYPGKADVRITRAGQGYWSYLGTDVRHVPPGQPTMCLQDFSLDTPESEYRRVVRHETGHTLGCPHEHCRKEVVDRIDPDKAVAYFGRTQGWSADEVRQQVLTPLDEASLLGTPHAETDSIMCYQLPGAIMRDGQPVPGGVDITEHDYAFLATVYPPVGVPVTPPVTPTPPSPPVTPPADDTPIPFALQPVSKVFHLPHGWKAV